MSVVPVRSTTGCFACKTKRKKCDETKPHCLRCQKSNIECPGYTYIQHPSKPTRKLRTLPAPRTLVGQSRAASRQGTPSVNLGEVVGLQLHGELPTDLNIVASDLLNNALGTPMVENVGQLSEAIDMTNPWVFLSSFSGSLQNPSVDLNTSYGLTLNTAIKDPVVAPPDSSNPAPMTSGQASLLEALLSLGQPPNPPSQFLQPKTDPPPNPSTPLVSNYWPQKVEAQDDVEAPDDEDPEGVVSVICRAPVLDKTAKGNALPFVLQSYATWIRRMAFEPLKMARIARDFVFSHFADGEESRWILTLLANVGSKIGNLEVAEGKHGSMVSMLQNAVRRRLESVKSSPNLDGPGLVKALDSAIETIIMNFFVSSVSDVVTLRQEAAPIFRRLCPGPPHAPINLTLILLHPTFCLRHYAHVDILFSVVMDMPMLFRYDTTILGNQPPNPYQLTPGIQADSGLQWLHGVPDPLIILLAKMKSMRDDRLTPNAGMTESFEQEIRELGPFSSSSSESVLVILRFVVQECWRQVAYVYLYMALCGDPSGTPRVKGAVKRFMKLLRGIKPGPLPDEFLIMNLILIAPAAQQKRDREVVRQRILGTRGRTFNTAYSTIAIMEDYWARADAEGRQAVWPDVSVSRIRVLGV